MNLLDDMEKKLKDLQRVIESLKTYNEELEGYSNQNYINYKSDIKENIDAAFSLPEEIKRIGNEIEDMEINRADLLKKKDRKQIILNKLENFEREAEELVTRVQQKEKRFDGISEETSSNMQRENSIGGQMKLLSLEKNSEIMDKRNEDLAKVHEASSELNKLSEVMKKEVYQQGEMLNDIEAHVEKTETNINKAKEQIKEADKLQKEGGKKTRCFIFIVLGVVAAIVAISLCIYFGKS